MSQQACRSCGELLPADARFCPSCGAAVAAAEGEERKLVTVLFADVIGSTRLAARLDAERYRAVMRAFAAGAEEVVASLRGRSEKFVGDAVMAVFGVPKVNEDDALRAVRAAMWIRGRAERLSQDLGLEEPLRLRIGLNSGPVAAGSGDGAQLLVSGAAVNLAARLQQAAEPGEILAGDTTWRLTRDAVEYGDPRIVPARGFDEPVEAHPVRSLSTRSSRRTIPFVGRSRERGLLLDTFERVRETSRPHLVTILGEPGIGKSRLAEEVLASVPEDVSVLRGSAGASGDETLGPIAQMLRDELDLAGVASADDVRERLEEMVAGCCDAGEVERTTARLGLALGLGEEDRGGHPYRVGEVRSGMEGLVIGLGRRGPVALVFEDLHEAHQELLELIEALVRGVRGSPLLALSLARDELLEKRSAWGAGIPDALILRLEPLPDEEAATLARAAGDALEEPTRERVVRLSGGNPYFIVETTGMLLERPPADGPARWVIPPTVQAAAASRIDHLDEPARRLLRTASVFPGGRFQVGHLAAITAPDPGVLESLEEAELLVPDGRPGRWRFRHEMLRHVAYESLAKRERVRLHLAVADHLEAQDVHLPQAIAHHVELAARASIDLGGTDPGLVDRAVEALAAAGDATRRRIESRAAADLYRRGLDLAGPESGWGVREARMLAGLGEARYWLGEFEQARAALVRALELGGEDPATQAAAGRFLADVLLNVDRDVDRATVMFETALSAARSLDDPWTISRTLLMAGWAPYWRNDFEGARRSFSEALEVARKAGDAWAEARALVSLASVVSSGGNQREVLELAEEALAIGRELDEPFTVAVAQQSVGNALRRMLRLDEALPHLRAAVAGFRELDARWELASTLGDLAYVHRLAGRPEEADGPLREALALCLDLGERALTTWTAAELAFLLLGQGRVEEARELLEGDVPLEDQEPALGVSARMAKALLARMEGDEEAAREHASAAVAMERERGLENQIATAVYWVGSTFGPDLVGGEDAVRRAEETLRQAGWLHAIREAELARQPKKTSATS
ncbi:MAG TPA: adenylate/guanylate cyclase domain-containing protein [Actinomycetota bacterium]